MPRKDREESLDDLASYSSAGGFGGGIIDLEQERNIADKIKHKELLKISQGNKIFTILNTFIAAVTLMILIYQVFFT